MKLSLDLVDLTFYFEDDLSIFFVTDEDIGGVQGDRSSTSCIWKVVAQGEKANLDKIQISMRCDAIFRSGYVLSPPAIQRY